IMIGVVAAWVSARFNPLWRRGAWLAALVGALLLVGMYLTLWRVEGNWFTSAADSVFTRVWRFNLVSLGAALLLPIASQWTLSAENIGSLAIRRIALWSYAIYLVQHPVWRFVVPRFFTHSATSAGAAWALFGVLLAATLAVSAILHYAYEAPCTRLRQRVGPAVRRFFQK
ncbi:MAG: Peptidoglycan/LPS O-acetylase OafA/YrhL, contains acyltransferase and SGNH-hydrolase domain, partial [Verrucomicrobia bacterium]|nr:Peptidoglycan/LPS O-acetylase OafA/YrhL, contains acyltransferase and SGNH-hydrolase domain [Verrucomicrobiota bacterium]